jgi:hypothetical protein
MQKTITSTYHNAVFSIVKKWSIVLIGLLLIQTWGSNLLALDPCANIGLTRLDIDVSDTDAGAALVSRLGDNLLIYYYGYNDNSEHIKMVSPEGIVATFAGTTISPHTDDNSDFIYYEPLNNGNIAVFWYSSSTGKGLTDTYFKVIDALGSEVAPATIINTSAGTLNRFTRMEQLSNGNLAFTWATSDSDYAMRRFTEDGVSVDTDQISLTELAGLSTSQYNYKIAANQNSHFMVVIEDFGQHYYGMIFENASSIPVQVDGGNSFIIADVTSSGHGDKISHVKTLSTDQFLVAYQVQTTPDTESRSVAYKIFNDDGSVAKEQTVIRQLHSEGYIDEPIVTPNGFYLSYSYNDLGNEPNLGYVPYLEFYDNGGILGADLSNCLPDVIGEWAEIIPFLDVDGNISFVVSDIDPGPDYDLWLLRSISIPTTPDAPVSLDATIITPVAFQANWEAVEDITGYRLDVSLQSDFSTFIEGYENLNVGDVTDYNVIGLSPVTTYYYRVRAVNGDETSESSTVISVLTLEDTSTSEKTAHIENLKLRVFPNPTSGLLIINLGSSYQSEMTISIFTIQGQLVLRKDYLNTDQITIDLHGLSKGAYILQTVINGEIITEKVTLN